MRLPGFNLSFSFKIQDPSSRENPFKGIYKNCGQAIDDDFSKGGDWYARKRNFLPYVRFHLPKNF